MRIALHMGTLRGRGSAVVGQNLLRELVAAAPGDDFLAWIPEEWPGVARDSPRVTLRTTRPGLPRKLLDENLHMRLGVARWGADVLFSVGDTSLVGCRRPHVLMVQQAHLAYPPEAWGFAPPRGFARKMDLMAAYLRAGLRSVDRITVQSEHMRAAFAERWSFPPERIDVVPSAIQGAARRVAAAPEPPIAKRPFLCYVSSGGPHKNHRVLAGAMAALRRSHPDLRCVVTVEPAEVPDLVDEAGFLGVLDRFDFRGTLPPDETMALLRRSTVAVIPSKLESFGIPYHEAMALGLPVVAADRPCAREPLGDAARYAPADDGAAWAVVIGGLLDDAEARSDLARAARRRFEALDPGWDGVARRYLEVLRAAAS
ncbi:MAG: glycosyltransferase [Myxococcota bacterium]